MYFPNPMKKYFKIDKNKKTNEIKKQLNPSVNNRKALVLLASCEVPYSIMIPYLIHK